MIYVIHKDDIRNIYTTKKEECNAESRYKKYFLFILEHVGIIGHSHWSFNFSEENGNIMKYISEIRPQIEVTKNCIQEISRHCGNS